MAAKHTQLVARQAERIRICGAKAMKQSPKKAKAMIRELKRAINLVLSEQLAAICTQEECKLASQAYASLNMLRNSLHRHLISKADLAKLELEVQP